MAEAMEPDYWAEKGVEDLKRFKKDFESFGLSEGLALADAVAGSHFSASYDAMKVMITLASTVKKIGLGYFLNMARPTVSPSVTKKLRNIKEHIEKGEASKAIQDIDKLQRRIEEWRSRLKTYKVEKKKIYYYKTVKRRLSVELAEGDTHTFKWEGLKGVVPDIIMIRTSKSSWLPYLFDKWTVKTTTDDLFIA